jgi:hypothetical protein
MKRWTFQNALAGDLGAWQQKACIEELEEVKRDLIAGRITIDRGGVARNKVGRALMTDMLEKLAYVADRVDVEATNNARYDENARDIAAYRKSRRAHGYSAEELFEMRAAFGEGTTVVDILTGESIAL